MHTATPKKGGHTREHIFPPWSRGFRSCFAAATVLAVASAAACGSLVELPLRPIVVIRECCMPRGKDGSQVNVVCMLEFVNVGHWE
jgi:hypothetical protein